MLWKQCTTCKCEYVQGTSSRETYLKSILQTLDSRLTKACVTTAYRLAHRNGLLEAVLSYEIWEHSQDSVSIFLFGLCFFHFSSLNSLSKFSFKSTGVKRIGIFICCRLYLVCENAPKSSTYSHSCFDTHHAC